MPSLLQIDRRTLLRSLAGITLAAAMPGAAMALDESLPTRRDGELDIHHIDTGRGNCTLIIAPDGTSIMIDAGASLASAETSGEARPNATRRPGQWQASYAAHHASGGKLDYLIVTHIHPDHIGDVNAQLPRSTDGSYQLSGVTDVDEQLPIATVIDRAYPDYGDTHPPASGFADNYLAWLKHRVANGRTVEAAQVGSDQQVVSRAPRFKLRFFAASGRVWNGTSAVSSRPALATLSAEDRPGENFYSLALRLTYGRFSYFHGGDLTAETFDGRLPWMDVETPVVRAAGRTEVAAADHHGYFDACGPEFVRALDAQAYVIQGWDVGHPGSAQLQRMLGAWSGKSTHDVFATDMLPSNQLINRRFTAQMKSMRGHVVVRVAAGGDSYRILVVDSSRENGNIVAQSGPYISRT